MDDLRAPRWSRCSRAWRRWTDRTSSRVGRGPEQRLRVSHRHHAQDWESYGRSRSRGPTGGGQGAIGGTHPRSPEHSALTERSERASDASASMMTDRRERVRRGDGPGPGLLRDDADGRPDVGLAAHLRSARADRRRHRRRPPGEPGRDQRDRADPLERGHHPPYDASGRPSRVLLRAAGGASSTFMASAGRVYRQLREIMEQRPRRDRRSFGQGPGAPPGAATTSWPSSRPRCPRSSSDSSGTAPTRPGQEGSDR